MMIKFLLFIALIFLYTFVYFAFAMGMVYVFSLTPDKAILFMAIGYIIGQVADNTIKAIYEDKDG